MRKLPVRGGPYRVQRPPLPELRYDWSTREAAAASFAALVELRLEHVVIEGDDGGPYVFLIRSEPDDA